jgi:hypothetical protein
MTTEQNDFKIGMNTIEESLERPKIGTFWKLSEQALSDEWFNKEILEANNLLSSKDMNFKISNIQYVHGTDEYESSASYTFTHLNGEFKISLTNEQFYFYFNKLNLN